MHTAVLLAPAVAGGLEDLQDAVGVCDGLALGDQLLSSVELEDDLLRCMACSFNGGGSRPLELCKSPGSSAPA